MLDLSAICGSLYEIKLADGHIYKLNRPTQGLYETIIKLGSYTSEDEFNLELMEKCVDVLTQILNRNTEGKVFTREEVEADYDFTVAMVVMGDYMKYYAEEIKSRVNFQLAQ